MQVTNFKTVEELDIAGAAFIINHLKGDESKLLCPATGSSATGIYQILADKREQINTPALKILKLDEWAGLPMDNPGSCEYYLHKYFLQPFRIPANNYIAFDSMATNPTAECNRIKDELETNGPLDVCVLGLGLNGHIAFNDPADALQPRVHLAKLSGESMAHPMVSNVAVKPTDGYTLGVADILQSKAILLVVHGRHKKEIYQRLLNAQISTQLPASFLWLHNNAHCYYCEN